MIATGYAQMYSGMPNPERELTEEESNKVKELVSQLKVPYIGPKHSKLGFTGFIISYKEENWCVISNFTCWCIVWSDQDQELKYYEDTVGLIGYLEEILTPMVDKHLQDMQQVMTNYYEEMFRVPK
jgi:hypothetical protein